VTTDYLKAMGLGLSEALCLINSVCSGITSWRGIEIHYDSLNRMMTKFVGRTEGSCGTAGVHTG